MAKLPITADVSQAAVSGGVEVSVTLTDATGVEFASTKFVAATPVQALITLRTWARDRCDAYLTFADLPPSFSVPIGLDTAMREIDLL